MKERGNNQSEELVHLPPAWCGAICRNAMSEMCVENCAIKRDTSYFEPKPNLNLPDMPRYPLKESANMTKEEKFTSLTFYLAKVVDYLQGVEDEYTHPIRRPGLHSTGSSSLPENFQIKDLLPHIEKTNPPLEVGEERKDSGVRSGEVAGTPSGED